MGDAIDERVTQFSVDWMLSERETEALHDLLAEVRAETEARVVEAAKRAIVELRYDNREQSAEECAWDEALGDAYREVERLAPADYVAVRREDFEVIAEATEELEARIRMERAGYESSRADEIRAALSRARKEG